MVLILEKKSIVDMVKKGIIDPTLVTRTAVQNAASIAGLLLTTEAVISDKPEPAAAPAAPAMPDMGGMGGMGGMRNDVIISTEIFIENKKALLGVLFYN